MSTISRQTRASDLALQVLSAQLRALRAHEDGTRDGSDPEELHDMRVATRRLRAALRCFQDFLPPAAADWRQELAWLARGLSAVRDLDVQLEHTDELTRELPESDRAAHRILRATLDNEREQARSALLQVLDSDRYRALLSAGDGLVNSDPLDGPEWTIEAVAFQLLEQPYAKLRRLGDRLDSTSPASDLHALRIRAKRLRYAVEFLTPAYAGPAERFVRGVVTLQDVLGLHQDAEVAIARLRSLASGAAEFSPEVLFTMGALAQRHTDKATRLRSAFPRAYRRVIGKRWLRLEREL
jgi:CHAD domain-containing protein